MRINASQKGTNIAHRHSFDPGASQYAPAPTNLPKRRKCNELSKIHCISPPPDPQQEQIFCRTMQYGSRHGHIEELFLWGTGGECNEFLIIYCIFFVLGDFWGRPRTLAPAAYRHDSVAKQWPSYCEAPGSKSCRSSIISALL